MLVLTRLFYVGASLMAATEATPNIRNSVLPLDHYIEFTKKVPVPAHTRHYTSTNVINQYILLFRQAYLYYHNTSLLRLAMISIGKIWF